MPRLAVPPVIQNPARLALHLRRQASLPPIGGADEMALASAAIEAAPYGHGDAFLAFTGDKRFVFSDSGRTFLMFGARGRARVALGEPIGLPEEAAQVEDRFRRLARRGRGWPAFYAVGPEAKDRLAGFNVMAQKVGERAVVDLTSFSISGKGKKDLRNAVNRAKKAGCRFEVLPPGPLLALEQPLRAVSDAWLSMRGGKEKAFSLGRFEPDYLSRFSLAIVWREDVPLAFANVWRQGDLVTIDLMRFADEGPGGGMDTLFVELALWAQAHGHKRLDLGLAPLAGLEGAERKSTVTRLGAFIYALGGRFYGFEGLRAFKDKFDPEWIPAYICAPNAWRAAAAAVAVAELTGGGIRELLRRTRKE